LQRAPIPGPIRFADNLPAPSRLHLDGHEQITLIPAEWSMVFCDSYVRQAARKAAEEKRSIAEENLRQALAVLLAFQFWQASQFAGESSGAIPE
jgi:hypothetical protein